MEIEASEPPRRRSPRATHRNFSCSAYVHERACIATFPKFEHAPGHDNCDETDAEGSLPETSEPGETSSSFDVLLLDEDKATYSSCIKPGPWPRGCATKQLPEITETCVDTAWRAVGGEGAQPSIKEARDHDANSDAGTLTTFACTQHGKAQACRMKEGGSPPVLTKAGDVIEIGCEDVGEEHACIRQCQPMERLDDCGQACDNDWIVNPVEISSSRTAFTIFCADYGFTVSLPCPCTPTCAGCVHANVFCSLQTYVSVPHHFPPECIKLLQVLNELSD
jgi:hypothetical protein